MKFMKNTLGLALVACVTISAIAALAGENKAAKSAAAPSQEELTAAWMKMAAPGENHERLKALAGRWKTSVKSWEGPGEPKLSEGSCEISVMMDGRYVKEECTGDFDGMPFKGMGLTGYDNIKKKFVSSWVDNLGTGIMNSEGTFDSAKSTLTFHSKMPDPTNMQSGKMVPVRMTTKLVDDDTHVFTMYSHQSGKETKQMEITYTRK